MKIDSIVIENFKVFKKAEIKPISDMVVLLGSNGSGKSTFFDIFGFLRDAVLLTSVTNALYIRGGFGEVITRGCDLQTDLIKLEINFIEGVTKNQKMAVITYILEIGFENGMVYINREVLQYRRGQNGEIWNLLDLSRGKGVAIINEEEYGNDGAKEKSLKIKMSSPDVLAIKGLGYFEQYKIISEIRIQLENWYVSDFNIENGKKFSFTDISHQLTNTGDNLAQVTKYMFDYHKDIFDQILLKLPKRIPGINNVEAKETEDGRIILRFKDQNFKDPFTANYVSDGTIKMFLYMILLNDPHPHPLMCIEEPENYLHPDILMQLCEEIREYTERGGQVFISSHSPDFINGVKIEELYFLTKENGFSVIKAAIDDELVKELANENQLGWLWRNHYINGANL